MMKGEGKPLSGDIHLAAEFLLLKKKHSIKAVIETGTYKGDTTEWLCNNFDKVYTAELNKEYYLHAHARLFGKCKNLQMFNANSVEAMADMLFLCAEKNPLIFLDAHWYANPLLGELEEIAKAGIRPVLVIHDFKVPSHPEFGYDTYPDQKIVYEWEYVKPAIEKIYGPDGYTYYYNTIATGEQRGCLFVEPQL